MIKCCPKNRTEKQLFVYSFIYLYMRPNYTQYDLELRKEEELQRRNLDL